MNIGNPQYFAQKPISFFREVLACTVAPSLLNNNNIHKDIRNRAQYYLDHFGSTGGYTASCGNQLVQQNIAAFLEKRDNFAADPNHIFVTNGASSGISL